MSAPPLFDAASTPPADTLWQVISLRTGTITLAQGSAQAPYRMPSETYGPYRLEPLDISSAEKRQAVLMELLRAMPASWQSRWCASPLCACMGAANCSGQLAGAGFSQAEWLAAQELLARAAGSEPQ